MNFVHVSLLAGSALAILPVMLHFLGRQEPKRITFPALRFVRETAIKTQRGWSIKRWLLLIMRMLLILLTALAFASPRVHSAMLASYLSIGLIAIFATLATAASLLSVAAHHPRSMSWGIGGIAVILWGLALGWGGIAIARGTAAPVQSGSGPICAAIVIDTSPAMDYRFANLSRMDEAKNTARWLMDRLPADSQIAIVTSVQNPRLHQGRVSANRQLDKVKIEGRVSNLVGCVRSSIDLVRSSKLERREVYVLSDMSANAWQEGANAGLRELLDPKRADPAVLVQVVDLGAPQRENWSITQLKLSQEVVDVGGTVNLSASIVASQDAPESQIAVELLVEDHDSRLPIIRNGKMVTAETKVIERQNVDVVQGGTSIVRFSLQDLPAGPTHAWLRLTRPDPLEIDNELALTVEAEPLGKVLVLGNADPKGNNRGRLAALMIDPEMQQIDLRAYTQVAAMDLGTYEAILMVDPPSLAEADIDKIDRAVQDGCGLMLIMGQAMADAKAWHVSSTAKLLPGLVSLQWRRPETDRSIFFDTRRPNHPVWSELSQAGATVAWNRYPVYKYWVIDPVHDSASEIIRYSSSSHPALLEQARGAGKVLTMTTPMTDVDSIDQPPWNRLFASDNAWENFGLLRGAIHYLSGSTKSYRNLPVGAPVTIDNPLDRYPQRYDLFTPSGEVVRVQTQSNTILYPYANELGTYRMRSGQIEKPRVRGFSTHLDKWTINLQRLESDGLDSILGKDQYFFVRERNALQTSLGQARFGRDLSPFLLCVLALLAIAEQAMSYRFYSPGTMVKR